MRDHGSTQFTGGFASGWIAIVLTFAIVVLASAYVEHHGQARVLLEAMR